MAELNMEELKSYIDQKFEEQRLFLEEKLKTTAKKTPVKKATKSPKTKKATPADAWKSWKTNFESEENLVPVCHYIPKSGQWGNMACSAKATYTLTGDPNKRTCQPIPPENIRGFFITTYGENPSNSYPFTRCNSHKNQATVDNISKSCEFIGGLENGAVVHVEETSPSEENIAASLSGKPMSPSRQSPIELMTPDDITGASGPKEEVSLPVVEQATSEPDNGDLEDLLSSLN